MSMARSTAGCGRTTSFCRCGAALRSHAIAAAVRDRLAALGSPLTGALSVVMSPPYVAI